MDASQLFFTQIVVNTLTYTLIALWYVGPRLRTAPLAAALSPLLFLEAIRTVGLVFLVPGVVGTRLPNEFAVPAAYGDLFATGLALVALVALRAGWRIAPAFVWLFSLEGTVDLFYAVGQGVRLNLAGNYALGPAWFIPTFLVPAALVTHVLIFWLLLRPRRGAPPELPARSPIATHA